MHFDAGSGLGGALPRDHFHGVPYASNCAVLEMEIDDEEALVADVTRTIKIALDSGAGNHVAGPQDVQGMTIEPSSASKKGLGFIASNGARIPNLGETKVVMKEADRSNSIQSTFQIAEVSRPLYSVSHICDEGCEVHFCASHAWVTKGDKEIARFPRERGLYVAEIAIQQMVDTGGKAAGFARQGVKA